MSNDSIFDLICIGGGAAGFFGAISYAELANVPVKVAILEGTNRPLTKVKISGGGRCNVTHHCFDPKKLVQFYPRGGKNLLNGFFKFGPQEMIDWLAIRNVPTVAEKDDRIFPSTNRSQSIIDCFLAEAEKYKITLAKGCIVKSIEKVNGRFFLKTKDKVFKAKNILLATGGMPQGHKLAEGLGHQITSLAPSLFTLKSSHPIVPDMAGISMQKVSIQLNVGDCSFLQTGPVLLTHWGFSGPAILKLSAFAAREFLAQRYSGELVLNWLPDIHSEDLKRTLKKFRQAYPKKKLTKCNATDMPLRLWQRLLELCELHDLTWANISDASIDKLMGSIQRGSYDFSGKGEFKEEFVTCGGIDLQEVNLRTFESRRCQGLYFAGEILDIDGITGGFNFQNAWTSSRLAAANISMGTPN